MGDINNGEVDTNYTDGNAIAKRLDFENAEVLKDITFVRIHIDSISMDEEDEYILELIRRRCLFGFLLEYNFPSLDVVSVSLQKRIKINAKSFTGTEIIFRHKRVVRVKILPEIVSFWKRNSLSLVLSARINTPGKYTVKYMGSCEISLETLLVPPFLISGCHKFVGPGFSATSSITIDVGSHVKSIMEKVESMRNKNFGRQASRTRKSSISRSKSRSRSASDSSRSGTRQGRSSDLMQFVNDSQRSLPRASEPCLNNEAITTDYPFYDIKLTVHSARRLPVDHGGPNGEGRFPSTYVTVTGDNGEILSSPVRSETFYPEWEWTEVFSVLISRQNLVVKLWRRFALKSDHVIAFVSIPLPPLIANKNEYEMSDLSARDKAPLITISISTTNRARLMKDSLEQCSSPVIPSTFSPRLQCMTRDEAAEKLKKNLHELEWLISKLKH